VQTFPTNILFWRLWAAKPRPQPPEKEILGGPAALQTSRLRKYYKYQIEFDTVRIVGVRGHPARHYLEEGSESWLTH